MNKRVTAVSDGFKQLPAPRPEQRYDPNNAQHARLSNRDRRREA
jgi:hypothetical protein